jgi:antitoxin (DNA-binding transcriptional repressor) of toxin-antitoxin stability system
MTTRFIGVKEFRQHMAKIVTQAKKKNERLILLRKNEPIFELIPLSKKDTTLEKLKKDIEEAEKDAKVGRLYSIEEIEKILRIKQRKNVKL